MHNNDRLQGILFDKEELIDLRTYSGRQRLSQAVTKTRKQLGRKMRDVSVKPDAHAANFAFPAKRFGNKNVKAVNQRLKRAPVKETEAK